MRLAPLVLLAMASALPAVLAQEGSVAITAPLPPESQAIRVGGSVEVPFWTNATCWEGTPPPVRVGHSVVRMPAWAVVQLSPAVAEAASCDAGYLAAVPGLVRVEATADAPAFQPEAVEVEARATWATGASASARLAFPVTALYAPRLEVTTLETETQARPGERVGVPIEVRNLGNGATRVDLSVEADPDVQARVPPYVVLQSRQAGGMKISAEVLLEAWLPADEEEARTVTLRWRSHYALDPKLAGDEGRLDLRLVPTRDATSPSPAGPAPAEGPSRGPLWDVLREVPGPSPLLAVLALGAAALVASRGTPREKA